MDNLSGLVEYFCQKRRGCWSTSKGFWSKILVLPNGRTEVLTLVCSHIVLHAAFQLRVWEQGSQRLNCLLPLISVTVSMTQSSRTSTFVGCSYVLCVGCFQLKYSYWRTLCMCSACNLLRLLPVIRWQTSWIQR